MTKPIAFADYPGVIPCAFSWWSELCDLGWRTHAFITYGATITDVPLEASGAFATPPAPDHTLVTVHLRLPDKPDFPIGCGYLDDRTWPAPAVLRAATEAWERLPAAMKSLIRRQHVPIGESIRLVRSLLERGLVPPKLKAEAMPTGRN